MTPAVAMRERTREAAQWTVLCIEDDPVVQILLSEVVRTAGAAYTAATTVGEAEAKLRRTVFDLILLDRRLPDGDGLLLLQSARSFISCPVMVLSELSDGRERQLGLGLGAAEYLPKPFSPVELSSRVRYALLEGSRARAAARANPIRLGSVELVPTSRRLCIEGRTTYLPPSEARLLKAFLEAPDEALTRDQLTLKTCGREWYPGDRTIDVLVARLRRRLPESVALIVTIHGTGYLLTLQKPGKT